MIYTHSGPFHADDVFAVAALSLLRRYEDLGTEDYCRVGADPAGAGSCVRTRDPRVLALFDPARDVMVDVGGVYDPAENRFDHHFVGAPRRYNAVPYAAFGMVWRHFGEGIVARSLCGLVSASSPETVAIAADVDRRLVQPVDAGDTGTALVADPTPAFEDVLPYSLGHAVQAFNPADAAVQAFTPADAAGQHRRFALAVLWARSLLQIEIGRAYHALLARRAVAAAIAHHLDPRPCRGDDEDSRVLVLEAPGPWQEAVLGDDRCRGLLYVVFPSDATWMVQGVPDAPGSFGQRKPLPAAWAGLRDADFAATTGVADAVFCHPNRFIAGARTQAGARALARLAAEA